MSARSALGREKHNTMPGTSRSQQKVEARYNVTTDYPHYDLHFAAASGNLGLVEFAVSHGQPVNSVLNGVLPLHAASAGGSEIVVRYLLEGGADVNAPRLPRRYSNDKHKSSGLAVGSSGSTALHFAAANGHIDIVRLLLSHGAIPDRTDKVGLTPEALAREKGWIECANLLSEWSESHAIDLPTIKTEEKNDSAYSNFSFMGHSEYDNTAPTSHDRRSEKMKRSIDNALHLIKSPLQLHHHYSTGHLRSSPSYASQPQPDNAADVQFSPSQSAVQWVSPDFSKRRNESATMTLPTPQPHADHSTSLSLTRSNAPGDVPSHRRPSLPQIFGADPISQFQRRLPGKQRRPRSAGTDAQLAFVLTRDNVSNQEDTGKDVGGAPPQGHSSALSIVGGALAPRKASSKISLRNLFRRANGSVDAGFGSGSDLSSSSASRAASNSPVPVQLQIQRSRSTNRDSLHSPSPSGTPPASPTSGHLAQSPFPDNDSGRSAGGGRSQGGSYRTRKASESVAPLSPLVPEDSELRARPSREDILATSLNEGRPSILRSHLRSTSSYSSSGSGSKALRFDAKSGTSEGQGIKTHEGYMFSVHGYRSTGSPIHSETIDEDGRLQHAIDVFSAARESPRDEFAENAGSKADALGLTGADLHPASAHSHSGHRGRGASFASSTSSSPDVSPNDDNARSRFVSSEFLFGLMRSSVSPVSTAPTSVSTANTHDVAQDTATELAGQGKRHGTGNVTRSRDESFSSAEANGSITTNISVNSDSSAHTDITIPSPKMCVNPRSLPEANATELAHPTSGTVYMEGSPSSSLEDVIGDPSTARRSPAYTALDLRGISNLAEAEALVRRTQQEILVSAELPDDGPDSPGVSLSAQLAAYGEILALERRFARGEKQREHWDQRSESEEEGEFGALPPHSASSAKESWNSGRSAARMRREISARRRAATAAVRAAIVEAESPLTVHSANPTSARVKPTRHKRPHTAEGSIHTEWNFAAPLRESSGEYTSANERQAVADTVYVPLELSLEEQNVLNSPQVASAHFGSDLPPVLRDHDVRRHSDIVIIETKASPIDPPDTPASAARLSLSSDSSTDYMTKSFATARPVRSRSPGPRPASMADTENGVPSGVPLVRISTEPMQLLQQADGRAERERDLPPLNGPVRVPVGGGGGDNKFERSSSGGSGLMVETRASPNNNRRQYSPLVNNSPSRSSPPKHHIFGGIKSFVQGLRGKS